MGSLAGNKPKDTYQQVLKLETDNVTTTPKTIEDGAGNDTALQLASDKVKANGKMLIETVASSSADVNAIVWDSSSKELKYRALGNNAFQDEALVYDSGWLNIPAWSSGLSAGLYNPSGYTRPQFRIIDRVVHFRGELLVPLESGGNVVETYSSYHSTKTTTVADDANQTGWSIDAAKNVTTPPLFDSSALFGDAEQIFQTIRGERFVDSSAGTAQLLISTAVDLGIDTSGQITLYCIDGMEEPPTSPTTSRNSHQMRQLAMYFEAGQYNLDWTDYRTATNGGGTLLNTWAQGASQFPFNFNGNTGDFFGGMRFRLDGCYYIIDKDVTIAQIKAAVAAL